MDTSCGKGEGRSNCVAECVPHQHSTLQSAGCPADASPSPLCPPTCATISSSGSGAAGAGAAAAAAGASASSGCSSSPGWMEGREGVEVQYGA